MARSEDTIIEPDTPRKNRARESGGHVEDLERYRARGYAMRGNRIAIDRPQSVVEVRPPSVDIV